MAFLAVVDTGSFTAAAKRLGLAKSNVSRRVARLEDSLGARLLERTTRRQRLTEVGETYHGQVIGAVEQLAEAARSVSELQGRPRGRLRVTAPADWNETMARLVAEFSAAQPEIQVEVDLSQRKVDLVAEGFDVALRAGRLEDSSLIARSVGVSVGHLYASPGFLARHREPTTLAKLSEHAFVLFRGRQGEAELRIENADGIHEVTVRGVITAEDFGFVRHALVHGAGIGFLPDFVAAPELEAGRLSRLLPDHCLERSEFHLLYPSTRHVSPKVRVFVDFCVEWIERELQRAAIIAMQHAPRTRRRTATRSKKGARTQRRGGTRGRGG